MTKQVRQSLGLMALAVVGLIVALVGSQGDGEASTVMQSVGLVAGAALGVIGLVTLAVGLLSSSGE